MNAVFPETPGLSGAFLQGWRRRPGSGISADNIEEVYAVIVKQAFVVSANADPALGSLSADPDGPVIFEGDQPANLLQNTDFADGGANWATDGGATAVFEDALVELTASGVGDLRQIASFGRQLRDRRIGISATAVAPAALAAPRPSIVASGVTVTQTPVQNFGADPLILGNSDISGAGVTATTLSARFPTLAVDDEVLSYSELAVLTTEYESDLVPFKPETDIIVIADGPDLPLSILVNGAERFNQDNFNPDQLTGLGWEDKIETLREGQAGDYTAALTQALPNDFENLWFNGYRRDALFAGPVPYLAPGDTIAVTRSAGGDYGFTLPDPAPELTHRWFTGTGKDDPCLWRSRALALNLDTLVIEPDRDRAYVVWRACWAIDDPLGGLGPIAPDANREATVTLEGAF